MSTFSFQPTRVYHCERSQEGAYQAMRTWTFRYLARHEIDPAKYSETLTRAWMLAVRHFMVHTSHSTSADDFIQQNPALLDSTIMTTHYSRDVLFSDDAPGIC